MTDKKPKSEIGLLRENLKFFIFDRVENTIEGEKEIEDMCLSFFDKAYEQGKLDLVELLEKKIKRMENNEAGLWEQKHITRLKGHLGWLKSQIKEGEKR